MDQDQAVQVPGNLRKLLAMTVRSVQWSYAIFWSMSRTQQGVLEWKDGYYNGDVKTRKKPEAMEIFKPDKMGLQRSKLLRELYESLSEGESSEEEEEQGRRACRTTLSPEDLSDSEWFYMVCMSFMFHPGQGLPGRALANDQTIWLSDAQYADSKVFSRSLLAKSGSVQTVLCFPYLGGVVELGSTELVAEDPALVQHVRTTLLDFSKPDCHDKYRVCCSSGSAGSDEDPTCVDGKMKTLENAHTADDQEMSLDGPGEEFEEDLGSGSPDYCSFATEHNHQSQVQSWHLTVGDFSNVVPGSVNSSDRVSQVLERSAGKISKPKSEPVKDNRNSEDLHYRRVVSTILRKSNMLTGGLGCSSSVCRSSFETWKNLGDVRRPLEQQKILKKMLFTVPLMHSRGLIKSKMAQDETLMKLENERLLTLRSMIPSAGIDKVAVLKDTIRYVQELEARLGKLESSKVKLDDMAEQTWENSGREALQLKRKACELELNKTVKVEIMKKGVLIEIKCGWREYLLLDIMDALNRLHLDAHSVQSSTQDGMFDLEVISKFRGTAVASAQVLKMAIWESICW